MPAECPDEFDEEAVVIHQLATHGSGLKIQDRGLHLTLVTYDP